jgi:hypothetical protein
MVGVGLALRGLDGCEKGEVLVVGRERKRREAERFAFDRQVKGPCLKRRLDETKLALARGEISRRKKGSIDDSVSKEVSHRQSREKGVSLCKAYKRMKGTRHRIAWNKYKAHKEREGS